MDSARPEADGWSWLTKYMSNGFCLTFAQGCTESDMLEAYGINLEDAELMTRTQAGSEFDNYYPIIRVGRVDDWAFSFEEGTCTGSQEDILLRAAPNSDSICLFRTATGLSWLTYASIGRRLVDIDLLAPNRRQGESPDILTDDMRTVGLLPTTADGATASAEPELAACSLLTARFAIRLDADAAEGPLLTAEMTPADTDWLDG